MHRHDKRKTAQPTPLSIISRHPAVPPLLRCTRLPAVPSPFGRACYPAAPSLFGRNPIVPLCRPVQKQPAALRYRPVGRRLAALTWVLFGHKPVTLLYRFCSHILHCPAAASLTDHSLPPAPCLSTAPFPRCATPFGCTHCLAMPLLLTGSTRCPAIQKPPCCAVPVRIFPAAPPCRMAQRQLRCPPFGYDIVSPAVRPASDAPYCTAMPPLRGNTLVTRPYPLFKGNPVARCPVHPWPESSPAAPPCRHAVAARRGGGSSLPDLFPVPNDPNGSFFFFCQAGFSMEVHRNGAFLFSNGQR